MMVTATFAKAEFDYCSITKKHTMCGTDQGYGDKCGKVLGSGISGQDAQEILRVHNELRAKIANGQERRGKPGPQPPAANMDQIVSIRKVVHIHSLVRGPPWHFVGSDISPLLQTYNVHFESSAYIHTDIGVDISF